MNGTKRCRGKPNPLNTWNDLVVSLIRLACLTNNNTSIEVFLFLLFDLELTITFTILTRGNNKEFLLVKVAAHSDLYDGGINHSKIPFDKIEGFIKKNI